MIAAPLAASESSLRQVEAFLFHEARLLDERRWDEWLALFTPEGMYWAPLTRGQTDTKNHISLFHEDALMRSVRARRLDDRNAWSQQPVVQTQHLVGNVQIEAVDGDGALIVVRSAFQMVEFHRGDQRLFAGAYTHTLRSDGVGFKIELKRVDLVNCDAVHGSLEVFI